jgi:hypothetical protein
MPRYNITNIVPAWPNPLDGYRYRNTSSQAIVFVTSVPPGGEPPPVPPVIDNVTAEGDIEPYTVLELDTTDEKDSFRRIILAIEFPALKIKEIAFDGDGFGPMYTNASNSQTTISDGYHFTLLRDGGWPSGAVILTPFVIDTSGAENP